MALIEFNVINCRLDLSINTQPRLFYSARLGPDNYIKLSTGKNLEDLKGSISVFPETGDTLPGSPDEKDPYTESEKKSPKVIGRIIYVPTYRHDGMSVPPSYEIQTIVPKISFDELLMAAHRGRLPSSIYIEVDGMEYGSAPDGSEKKWDNKTLSRLNVTSIDFLVPLVITPQATTSQQPEAPDETFPPTRSQVNALLGRLDLLAIGIKNLFWAILAIGALILILRIFR